MPISGKKKNKRFERIGFCIEKVVDISDLEKRLWIAKKYRETGTIVRSKLDRIEKSEMLDIQRAFGNREQKRRTDIPAVSMGPRMGTLSRS
ncbi:hypothetical protein TNIN_100251 [Trichonephila inaurata madagascariensis]|uniref:Uncharacterized protein n=1 Tax=Trichonephila inaurata madagascariensis TaxID=2747483 RepID=A0A8X7BTQ5_9ARAC|nr:hypothetical protein TNIN_100251 [Trichonephila inaurata madagascariensis]